MAELAYFRLLYSGLLAILLALLCSTFIPQKFHLGTWLERHSHLLIWVLWVGAAIVFWIMGVLKYAGLHNSQADLGLYANTLWVTLHGKLLGTAITSGTYLDCHFSPSFLVLALLYAPWQSPLWLIGMQDIAAASGALALYLLVRQQGGSGLGGLLFGFIWVSSFALRGAILYDFHEVTMVSGLLMWLTYLILRKHWIWALLLAIFLLGIKEDMPVYLSVLGFLLAGSFKQWRWGLLLMGISIFYYALMQMYIWSALAPQHLDFVALRFPSLATGDGNIIGHILANPGALIGFINQDFSLWLILMVILPVVFLPFLRWGGLGLLLPLWMIVNLDITGFFLFGSYHQICPVALFFIGGIPGWFWLKGRFKAGRRFINWLLISMGLTLNLALPRGLLFSQISPASYSAHPSFENACRIARETPADISLAADRMMGSLYTRHFFADMFPSKVLTERMYLSPSAISSPYLVLALGGLGYKGIATDPYLWFLSRDGSIDLRESFITKMSWMEAENANLVAWQLVKDPRASGGKALLLPECGDWGQRFMRTSVLLLPPGEYSYSIRMRTARAHRVDPKIFLEVRELGDIDRTDPLLAGYTIPIGNKFIGSNYEYLTCSFTNKQWAKVYLNINFSLLGDVYWDGIWLEGIAESFASYYQQLFPQSVEAYAICNDQSAIITDQNSISGKVVIISPEKQGQNILWLKVNSDLPAGDYKLYYTVNSTDSIEENMDWGTIVSTTDDSLDSSGEEEIARLGITRDYMSVGCLRLEDVGVRLEPNMIMMIKVRDDLDKKILLDKLWISALP